MTTATISRTPTLQFADELTKVNIVDKVYEIAFDLEELNNGEWSCDFGSRENIIRLVEEIIGGIDFYHTNYVTDYGCYWSGILTAAPFCDIHEDEETILNLILKYHLKVSDDGWLEFSNPVKSPLYRFFLKYRDGYGGNISYSINSLIWKVVKIVDEEFRSEEFINRHGQWLQSGFCEVCVCSFFLIRGNALSVMGNCYIANGKQYSKAASGGPKCALVKSCKIRYN